MGQKHLLQGSCTIGSTFQQLNLREKIDIYNYVQRRKEKSSRELSQEILEKFSVYLNARTVRKWREGWRPKWLRLAPSPELAYLIGLVLGDGSIDHKKVANGYYVIVQSTKKELPELFRDACAKIFRRVYPVSPAMHGGKLYYRCMVGSKELYELIRSGRKNIYNLRDYIEPYPSDFIRGFADAEGSVTFYKPKRGIIVQVKVTNTDKKLLLFIKNLLSQMGIYASIKVNSKQGKVNKTPSGLVVVKRNVYDLAIARQRDVIRYSELIGFDHPEKRKKLEEAVKFIKSWQEKLVVSKFNKSRKNAKRKRGKSKTKGRRR